MWLRFGQWMFVLTMLLPLLTWTAFSVLATLVRDKTSPEKFAKAQGTLFSAKGEAK